MGARLFDGWFRLIIGGLHHAPSHGKSVKFENLIMGGLGGLHFMCGSDSLAKAPLSLG